MREIKYANAVSGKSAGDVSTEEIVFEAIEMIMILGARSISPKQAKSIPIITKIPQLIASIADEKKLAIAQLSQSRHEVLCEMNVRIKEMSFTVMDKFMFERNEKEVAWLLLKAYSTAECIEKLHTSEGQFRYCVRRMCKKTNTNKKDDLVTLLRHEIDND